MNERDRLFDDFMQAAREIYAAVDLVEANIAAALGVHRSDLRCLNILENGPYTTTEIGKRTGLTSGSVTALVDRLERAGFVERQRSKTDRRSVLVGITEESYPRIGALYGQLGAGVRARFKDVDDDGLRTAAEILRTFAAGCEDADIPDETSRKKAP